jgi:hypothetical protein
MDVRKLCIADYQEYIKLADLPTELKRALKTEERVPVFIDNLARQIHQLPVHVSRTRIKECVYDMTKIFISCVQKRAEFRTMSDLEKRKLEVDQANLKVLRDAADALIKDEDYVREDGRPAPIEIK